MTDLLIDRDVRINAAPRGQGIVGEVLGKAQQDTDRELVIQKAALDVAGLRDARAWLEADKITDGNAQLFHVVGVRNNLVKHDLHRLPFAGGVVIIVIHMERRIAKLQGALIRSVEFGHNTAVFRLGVVGVHAADVDNTQATVRLDLRDHAAERVRVSLQQQGIVRVLAAEVDQDTALVRARRGKAQRLKLPLHEFLRRAGVTGRAVDRQKCRCFFDREVYIILHLLFSFVGKSITVVDYITVPRKRTAKTASRAHSTCGFCYISVSSFQFPALQCRTGEKNQKLRSLEAISLRHFASNASGVIAPRSTPPRVRTETVPFSMSRSPMTSIYGIF